MSYEKWKKGIVVGISNQSYFVASSQDEHVLPKTSSNVHFSIGDCINFISSESAHSNGSNRRNIIWKFEKCAQFVEWELQNHKNAAVIKSNIIDVTIENHPHTNVPVRCLRTNFLEKVYDTGRVSKTSNWTDSDLLKMKVVAVRITNDENTYLWAVLGCKLREEIKVDSNSKRSNKDDRIKNQGIVLTLPSKDYFETIYIWVPGRRRHIALPKEARKGKSPNMFHGRWISFDLNNSFEIDDKSEIKFVDDYLSTRFRSYRYEVKVPVNFDKNRCKSEMILDSEVAGLVVDTSYTLQKYNKESRFSGEAWVYYFTYDTGRNIRFVLSEQQDEWDSNKGNSIQYREDRSSGGFEERGRSSNSYQDDFKHRHDQNNSQNREKDSTKYDFKEELPHNKTYEKSCREKRIEKEISENENGDRRRPECSYEIQKTEDNATSSRGRSGMSVRKYESRNNEEYGTRESSKLFDDEEDRQPGPSRSRAQRDQSVENRRNVPPRSDRSPSSKRDDISVKSVGDPSNSNLRKLKKRYEYLMANDMNIPEKLLEDLKNALIEDQELAKKKNVDYSDFEDSESGISGIREKRELAKIEVNEEELKTYKELVILFREMLSSPRVCEEMQRFDSKSMREINRLLLDL